MLFFLSTSQLLSEPGDHVPGQQQSSQSQPYSLQILEKVRETVLIYSLHCCRVIIFHDLLIIIFLEGVQRKLFS